MEANGERCNSDSDDGSSASWVILNEGRLDTETDELLHVDEIATEAVEPAAAAEHAPPSDQARYGELVSSGDPTSSGDLTMPRAPTSSGDLASPRDATQSSSVDQNMTSSDDSDKTVFDNNDADGSMAGPEPAPEREREPSPELQLKPEMDPEPEPEPGSPCRPEDGSDIEVIAGEPLNDDYFEEDPILHSREPEGVLSSSPARSLPVETMLRRRPDHDGSALEPEPELTPEPEPELTSEPEPEAEPESKAEPESMRQELPTCDESVRPDGNDRDRWAEDTDLSTQPDQTLPDSWCDSPRPQYVHRRNNAVNQLLSVLLVLCLACALSLGTGHFLGWLHHRELTEDMVQSLDERLDVMRDDLMTCMTTEDDQDLDNKWIKELLYENEALMHQLQEDDTTSDTSPSCSQEYALLRDQVNQLRMENDELKASIAKMRYGTASQDGHVLRRHRDHINQLLTENGELARVVGRFRYGRPADVSTHNMESEVASSETAPEPVSRNEPVSVHEPAVVVEPGCLTADCDEQPSPPPPQASNLATSGNGAMAALLAWRPTSAGAAPLAVAPARLWPVWREAEVLAAAPAAVRYPRLTASTLQKLEARLRTAHERLQRLDAADLPAAALHRHTLAVVTKLDSKWQKMKRRWQEKVAKKDAGQVDTAAAAAAATSDALNATEPSVAAFYARRSRYRHQVRDHEQQLSNWQLNRGRSRAEQRGAFHASSWLLERARSRQQLRQRRGEQAELPEHDNRWQQQKQQRQTYGEDAELPRADHKWQEQRQRGDWSTLDDDDDDNDDEDDDDDYAERLARTVREDMRRHQNLFKSEYEKADVVQKKLRENHWKHFGGRNRHDYHERANKY